MSDRQLLLDLPVRRSVGRDDFFVTSANEMALRKVDGWRDWAGGKLVLCGPEASGKSHLVAIWAEQASAEVIQAADLRGLSAEAKGAIAVEDVDQITGDTTREEALFHLHNAVMNADGTLLLTGKGSPGSWGIKLPDLASRVLAADVVHLGAPDDALLAAVLIKHFDDRQLNVGPELITYLTNRIVRSFAQAEAVVAQLDSAAMATKRKLTVRFASEVFKRS